MEKFRKVVTPQLWGRSLRRLSVLSVHVLLISSFPPIIPSPFDACLREAASAKAGGRVRVGVDKMKTFWSPRPFTLLNKGL